MSGEVLGFWIPGVAVPQGSKRIGRAGGVGRPILIDDNDARLKPWRAIAINKARYAWRGQPPLEGPVAVQLNFWLPRPATVTRWRPSVKPDGDKLERAIWDALTAAKVWKDDGQVVEWSGSKHYAEPIGIGSGPGVYVGLRELRAVGL